jgi:hypothetical protein
LLTCALKSLSVKEDRNVSPSPATSGAAHATPTAIRRSVAIPIIIVAEIVEEKGKEHSPGDATVDKKWDS